MHTRRRLKLIRLDEEVERQLALVVAREQRRADSHEHAQRKQIAARTAVVRRCPAVGVASGQLQVCAPQQQHVTVGVVLLGSRERVLLQSMPVDSNTGLAYIQVYLLDIY